MAVILSRKGGGAGGGTGAGPAGPTGPTGATGSAGATGPTGVGDGGSFNGGTITEPLEIAAAPDTHALTISAGPDPGVTSPADTAIIVVLDASRTDSHLLDAFSGAEQTLEVRPRGGVTITDVDDGGNALEVMNGNGLQVFVVNGDNGSLATHLTTRDSSQTVLALSSEGGPVLYAETQTASFRITEDAAPVIALHSAPPDASISAGEVALWFDQTDGAAKLKIKGKSADGTVVTGEVALA